MKRLQAVAIISCLLYFGFKSVTDSECLAGQMRGRMVSLKEGIYEMHESGIYYAADVWPSARPSGAVSALFRWSSVAKGDFKIYVWRDAGDTWMEIEPRSHSQPFVCSADFRVIQNNVEFLNVKLETSNGFSQCGYVYMTSIFKLTLRVSRTAQPDLTRPFTLVYEGASAGMFQLVIPGGTSRSALPSVELLLSSLPFCGSALLQV